MSPQVVGLMQLLAYIGLALGVIGAVAPIIPGPLLIWLSALLWAWADGFQAVGWPTLLVLALIAIVAELSDVALAALGAKKGGASWMSMIVAGAAAIIGLIVFNLIGALAGAFLGLLAWEAHRHDWRWRQAWQASGGFIIGYLLAMVVKLFFVAVMLALFIWQAFYA